MSRIAPMKVDLPYLVKDTDRHSKARYYVRLRGKKQRLREPFGSPEFRAEYELVLAAMKAPARIRGSRQPVRGTLEWLGRCYMSSAEFRQLDARSQRTRINILESCFAEPRKPGSADRIGDCPLSSFGVRHVQMLRDRKAARPGAANNRLKYISSMFAWAIEHENVTANPVRDVKPISYGTSGFHTWTLDEVAAFEERHAIGTKARLALALLLFLGPRRGDLVTLGKQHVRRGVLTFVPNKTLYKRADPISLPVLPALQEIIDASPTGDLTFLVTEYGKAFTAAGFGNWFRDRCNEAGLPQCSAHGLRKAGATMAAERGASDRQLMALYGWSSSSQATTYTRAANQKLLAASAARLLDPSEGWDTRAGSPREITG